MPVITLITDFGTVDGYVGEVKGVLLSRAADSLPVDVTHSIPPGDIRAGAWALARIWARYSPGTVHLAVVDPGVGGPRRPVAVRAEDRWFVGPDNGLVSIALQGGPPGLRERSPEDARLLLPSRVGLPDLSDTFHGRDLFAPAAAHLAAAGDPNALGPSLDTDSLVRIDLPRPVREGGVVRGAVIHVDRFGNLVTNVPAAWLPERPVVRLGEHRLTRLARSFAEVAPGEVVLVRGSVDTIEIAVRDGSAARRLGVSRDGPVVVLPG